MPTLVHDGNDKKDSVLLTAIKDGCRVQVVKDAIALGANVNTTQRNSLLLCLETIKQQDCANFLSWQVVSVLLEAGVSMEYRTEALSYGKQQVATLRNSEYEFQNKKGEAMALFVALIENFPPPTPNMGDLPTVLVACSTAKAWTSLLFSEKHSDIVFVFVGEDVASDESVGRQPSVLHAHRNVLAASSPYFSRYFDSEWGQRETFETSNSKSVMEVVLTFVYSGLVPSPKTLYDFAEELFSVAAEYEIDDLRELAEASLVRSLCLENFKTIFALGDIYGSESLKAACGDFVRKNARQLLFDEDISQLKQDNLTLWKELRYYVVGEKHETPEINSEPNCCGRVAFAKV